MYIAVSLALLLAYFAFGKGLSPQLLHFQAMASILPLTFLATAVSFLSYARLKVGRFPLPHQPGPGSIGLSLQLFCILWIIAVGGSLLGYILLHHLGFIKWVSLRRRVGGILVCAAGWLAFFLITKHDPLYFFDWLGD